MLKLKPPIKIGVN